MVDLLGDLLHFISADLLRSTPVMSFIIFWTSSFMKSGKGSISSGIWGVLNAEDPEIQSIHNVKIIKSLYDYIL